MFTEQRRDQDVLCPAGRWSNLASSGWRHCCISISPPRK